MADSCCPAGLFDGVLSAWCDAHAYVAPRAAPLRRYGGKPSAAYSQRDVPGITRAVVPVFARNGIRIISVGSNGLNEAPIPLPDGETAPVFRWRVGGEEVYVLFHRGG